MEQHQPTIMGLRRSAILETLLFLGLCWLVDSVAFSGERFFSVSPHPFWVIVLIVSVQYGTGAGLFAAIASSLLLLIGNLPEHDVSQDYYAYLLYVSANPLMWITAAVVTGELRQRHIRERDHLKEQLQEALDHEDQIAESYDHLHQIKENLEARIAGQLRSSISAYSAAKSMDKLRPSEVISGIDSLILSVLNPKKFSVYMLKSQHLENIIQHGWNEEDRFTQSIAADAPIFHEIIGRQRILCAVNEEDEKTLAGQGVLAGPIVNPETGEIIGMVKIEEIGFTSLNLTSIEEFRVLCEWIGLRYGNAIRYEKAEADSMVSHGTNLLSSGFFERQTDYLTSLGKRAGFDVSLLAVRLTNAAELSEEEYREAAKALSEAVRNTLRAVDQAFEHQRDDANFAVLLPMTPLKNAQIVTDKIKATLQKKLRNIAPKAQFSYTSHPLYEAGKVLPKRSKA